MVMPQHTRTRAITLHSTATVWAVGACMLLTGFVIGGVTGFASGFYGTPAPQAQGQIAPLVSVSTAPAKTKTVTKRSTVTKKAVNRVTVVKTVVSTRAKTVRTTVAPPLDDRDPKFRTCGEANANNYGPYIRGIDPEYDWYQDRDGDGIVCEF